MNSEVALLIVWFQPSETNVTFDLQNWKLMNLHDWITVRVSIYLFQSICIIRSKVSHVQTVSYWIFFILFNLFCQYLPFNWIFSDFTFSVITNEVGFTTDIFYLFSVCLMSFLFLYFSISAIFCVKYSLSSVPLSFPFFDY